MSQFKSRAFKVSPRPSSPESYGPVTPRPESYDLVTPPGLAQVSLPDTDPIKQRLVRQQLRMAVSGAEPFSHDEVPTTPVPAIVPATRNATARTRGLTKRFAACSSYSNTTLAGLDLLGCAIWQHMRNHKVIPRHLFVPTALFDGIVEDMKNLYRETCNGTVPFLIGQGVIQSIPISIDDAVPENTVRCEN